MTYGIGSPDPMRRVPVGSRNGWMPLHVTILLVVSAPLTAPLPRSGGGKVLAGFLLSGFLLALLGAILPVWGYHRDPDFTEVGNYFLSMAVGIVTAGLLARPLMHQRGLSFLLVFACAVSCGALGYLGWVSPPASQWWRVAGLVTLGIGAGLLHMALFYAISRTYQSNVAATVNRGGIWYGLGCLTATLAVATTVYIEAVPGILTFLSIVPGIFAGVYAWTSYDEPVRFAHPSMRQALMDFRSPGAVLFALLLFFQFGNEWSIAGWLPLFLIRRVGLSPKTALIVLAFYWLFLMIGRLAAVQILPRVRHGWLLVASALAAIVGCAMLYSTNNLFGAALGALLVGAGYASIYPLVAEAIGRRFPYYHPGFFNGIFSLALLGGLVAPATLGYVADAMGIGIVMGIPLLGTCMVMALLSLIWLESKVTGR
jgi:MFS transporter, FHS family, glucose/mannose:H+ symporter